MSFPDSGSHKPRGSVHKRAKKSGFGHWPHFDIWHGITQIGDGQSFAGPNLTSRGRALDGEEIARIRRFDDEAHLQG